MSRCIFDIGANTGLYALIAKTLNPVSRVYAFEPVERVFDKMRKNFELNGYDIVCEQRALSSYDGTGVIYVPDSEHVYSVTVNKNTAGGAAGVTPTDIKTSKLSTYIRDNAVPQVDLMKIDVESHEAEVLAGMEQYLARMRPAMLIEILNDDVGRGVEKILSGKDYLFYYIGDNSSPVRVDHLEKRASHNYLACSGQTAKRLRLLN
jgi:FkbM family methyltransferase